VETMTRRDLQYLLKLLEKVKPRDEHVEKAIAIVDRDLANYNARKGQMKDNYDYDNSFF